MCFCVSQRNRLPQERARAIAALRRTTHTKPGGSFRPPSTKGSRKWGGFMSSKGNKQPWALSMWPKAAKYKQTDRPKRSKWAGSCSAQRCAVLGGTVLVLCVPVCVQFVCCLGSFFCAVCSVLAENAVAHKVPHSARNCRRRGRAPPASAALPPHAESVGCANGTRSRTLAHAHLFAHCAVCLLRR